MAKLEVMAWVIYQYNITTKLFKFIRYCYKVPYIMILGTKFINTFLKFKRQYLKLKLIPINPFILCLL